MTTLYSRAQIILHWLIAVLILVAFFSHEGMKDAWRAVERGSAYATPIIHIVAGLSVLAFAIWRLIVRFQKGAPALPASGSALTNRIASLVHLALYALIVIIPVTGAAAWFGGFADLGEVHETLFNVLWVLVAVHVAGALYHQFVLKDGLMRRMFRSS